MNTFSFGDVGRQ